MVMGYPTQRLMLAGAIRGFAEALALAEVSVGAGAVVTAEADLVIGSRFKLAFNCGGWILCQEDIVQVWLAGDALPVEPWNGKMVKAE